MDPAKLAYGGGPASRDDEQRAFDASVAAGATLFDTAEMYGAGASERRLGELAHGRDVLIATKFPPNMLSRADVMPRALAGAFSSSSARRSTCTCTTTPLAGSRSRGS